MNRDARRKLEPTRLILAPAVAALAGLVIVCCQSTGDGQAEPGADEEQRAELLFERHCEICHGRSGRGDGPAAHLLFPPARDFGSGSFSLVSTRSGAPSEADLVATLRRGMPGSAMPAWGWMSDADLLGLARHVRSLAAVDGCFDPGPALEEVPPADPTPIVLARGAELFGTSCAGCHGDDGRGRPADVLRNDDGSLTWARDFTRGVFKGGASHDALANRIRAGMPGTAMPSIPLDREHTAALVAFVRSLVPDPDSARGVQVRRKIVAQRTAGAVPTSVDDPRWSAQPSVSLALAPLEWSSEAVLEVELRAVHDGEKLALLLEWPDATNDDRVIGGTPYVDGAAVQLSSDAEPALFGMGSAATSHTVWHWRAASWEALAGFMDLLEPAHASGRSDAPAYAPAADEGMGAMFEARGFEGLRKEVPLEAQAAWGEGRWRVVMSRGLEPGDGELALVPGQALQIACAVWNGAAGDHSGKKSISIWQDLVLE